MEFILEKMKLAGSTQQLENERESHYVFEDNFNASLKDMIQSKASYTKLEQICYRYENREGENSGENMINHERRVELSHEHFLKQKLWLLLSRIPFYWGHVTRACELNSSKKGKKGHDSKAFKNRNTLFKIYSLTGRSIKDFSSYPEEDEVLFLPHSTFIVLNRKASKTEEKNTSVNNTTVAAGTYGHTYTKSQAHEDDGMMHNTKNTNIDILLTSCEMRNLNNSRQNCVLITTGSFNPVHPFHFQNLLRVKEHLEREHQPPMNVLAGYISPTHDSYVHSKLDDSAWIPAKDRCRLCEEAIEYEGSKVSSWIAVSRGESEWYDGFVDFSPVTENLRDFLNTTLVGQNNLLRYPLRVIYVCGLDHYNKCTYVERMVQQNNMSCAIVYRRGCDEQQINRSLKTTNVIYVSLSKERTKLTDVSSTQIREYFQNPTANNTNIERNIYPSVRDYMRRKHRKK
ncbi:unnamed protein product [Adineta ricciae]|uniref:NAD(P)(+)--arginine ADP-ribosyltransferase n=1 Tax=Adineta ricciae TaxID=249248 RepID=A0A815J3Q3_ADIRI|nr:unnamed protein product [Adineta ricciae]CAF1470006.1 unnamed protein product [Adineta ricciae]